MGRVALVVVAGLVVVMCSAGHGAGAMVGAGWFFWARASPQGGVAMVSFLVGNLKTCEVWVLTNMTI